MTRSPDRDWGFHKSQIVHRTPYPIVETLRGRSEKYAEAADKFCKFTVIFAQSKSFIVF